MSKPTFGMFKLVWHFLACFSLFGKSIWPVSACLAFFEVIWHLFTSGLAFFVPWDLATLCATTAIVQAA